MQSPLRLPRVLTARFGAHFTRPMGLSKTEWQKLIAFAASFTDKTPQDNYSSGGEIEFPEGREYEMRHKARERNPTLVEKAKAQFRDRYGRLFYEVCFFDFQITYGMAGEGFIEAHHKVPLSELESGAKVRIADLALVCSNCHRILHRRRPWLTISALRKIIKHARQH